MSSATDIGKKYNPRVSIFRGQNQQTSKSQPTQGETKRPEESPVAGNNIRLVNNESSGVLSPSSGEESKQGSPIKRLGKPILKKSRFADPRQVRSTGSTPINRMRITIREQPIVHEVENWKRFNVPDDPDKPNSCTCRLM
eukprot:TRINITY_DN10003_c0_g2_i1.p1 TRINITY_DN10003_c0_g2~~TRINITY_DN10003_c0_g2_i1.p1  ORF type:complete len:140 (+),score=14.18 TRINITY_DN10003_c0_g2_i1:39-458(+)